MKRLNRAAARALQRLDQWPLVKLSVVAWVVATSVYASVWVPYASWRRREVEDARAGFSYQPSVSLGIADRGLCTLTNIGDRALSEASLNWSEHIVDVSSCKEGATTFHNPLKPPAVAHDFRPFDALTAGTEPERLKGSCYSETQFTVLECRATIHRTADMKPFVRSEFAMVIPGKSPDCDGVKPVRHLIASVIDGRVTWTDERFGRVWACLRPEAGVVTPESVGDFLGEVLQRTRGVK